MPLTSLLSAMFRQSVMSQALYDILRYIRSNNVHIPCAHFDRNF